MADVEGALAKAAAEDGGAVFECRPRGWPPGWRLRAALITLLLSPLLVGWVNLGLSAVRLRDHDPRWTASWTQVSVRVTDQGKLLSAHARGPLWGLTHPLVPGLSVPWVLLAGLAAGAIEAVRLARYRGRRIAVTSCRLLVGAGLLRASVLEVRPLTGARVSSGPGGTRFTCDILGPPALAWSTSIALGRLDPLDLADLTRALHAPPPEPPAPRRRRWPFVVALAAAVVALALLLAVAPRRATLTLSLSRQRRGAEVVLLALDGPAWGHLRSPVTPWSHAEQTRAWGSTTFRSRPGWLTGVAIDGGPPRDDALLSDQAAAVRDDALTRRLDDRLLRRRDARTVDIDVEPVLDELGRATLWHGKARPHGARGPVRVTGQVLFVEGPPLPFDVTLAPGESVTLDLADLRERAARR